jgi:hypothetical protein
MSIIFEPIEVIFSINYATYSGLSNEQKSIQFGREMVEICYLE